MKYNLRISVTFLPFLILKTISQPVYLWEYQKKTNQVYFLGKHIGVPSAFCATLNPLRPVITDKKGKQKKVYNVYQTPYERFKSLPDVEQYLKPGITFEMLDRIAYQKSDNDFAEEMQEAKDKLFKNFKHIPHEMIEFTSFISCSYVD